jgi:hypothetical protein
MRDRTAPDKAGVMSDSLHGSPSGSGEAPLRKTGIGVVGAVPWGTHFCQFYQTKEDLVETLVPYFKEGLKNNEFCMWITSAPLQVEEARTALSAAVPDLDERATKGQIEILDYSEWYTKSGVFDSNTVLKGWVEKLDAALERSYDGLRLSGNTFWLEAADWDDFTLYEEAVNNVIGRYKMLAICTYSLDKCGASEIIDVVNNHQFALIKRRNKWEMMQSARIRKAEEKLKWQAVFPEGRPHPLAKAISLFVTVAGLAVMAGWIFDIGILKSLSPAWISMKFSTAIAFVASGVTLYFLVRAREGEFEKAQVALSITSLVIALIMGLLFFSDILGVETGIENLFVKDTDTIKSMAPGMPSAPTMINFMLIALAAIMTLLNSASLVKKLKVIGIVIGAVGILSVAGYIFNTPLFYYYIEGVNSAMALHTSLLFVLLGAGLACL